MQQLDDQNRKIFQEFAELNEEIRLLKNGEDVDKARKALKERQRSQNKNSKKSSEMNLAAAHGLKFTLDDNNINSQRYRDKVLEESKKSLKINMQNVYKEIENNKASIYKKINH